MFFLLSFPVLVILAIWGVAAMMTVILLTLIGAVALSSGVFLLLYAILEDIYDPPNSGRDWFHPFAAVGMCLVVSSILSGVSLLWIVGSGYNW